MRIASFGDIHLGPDTSRDRYRQNEERLLRFCDALEEQYDKIVLVGDIYQADYGSAIGPQSEVISEIRQRYSQLTKRWHSGIYTILFGNHDAVAADVISACESMQWVDETSEFRVLYLHGHQFDPIAGRFSQKFIMWAMGRMRYGGYSLFCDYFEESLLERGHRLLLRDEHLGLPQAAQRLIENENWTAVIMGHSHRTACIPLLGGVYANSGVCRSRAPRYVSVDTSTGTVQVRKFLDTGKHEVMMNWQL